MVAPLSLVVVQNTSFCNIDCRYCYLPSRNVKSQQSLSTVRSLIERLKEYNSLESRLTLCWHAGEPLVSGEAFFEEVFEEFREFSRSSGVKVGHSIQTNGTLLNESWISLFEQNDVHVGISIDGPAAAHDANRVTRAGVGTHAKVLRGLRQLVESRVSFGAIAVVGETAMANPLEFHRFFESERVPSVGLNVPEIEGINTVSFIAEEGAYQRFKAFVAALAAETLDRRTVVYREIQSVLDFARSGGQPRRSSTATLGHILNVTHDGRYSSFAPEMLGMTDSRGRDFFLGDVRTTSIRDAFRSARAVALDDEIKKGISACRAECGYFDLCGGGSPSNKLAELGAFDGTRTAFCMLSQRAAAEAVMEVHNSAKAGSGRDRAAASEQGVGPE